MANVLVSGGSGLIGRSLCQKLIHAGFNVSILSRSGKSQQPGVQAFKWDPQKGVIDKNAVIQSDYIIHLAGEDIFEKRWNKARKIEILDSRIKTAELLLKCVEDEKKSLNAFISASAIGYYGAVTSEKIFTETDPPANDFLGNVCRQWEECADAFQQTGTRVVKIRTSPVITPDGGFLKKMKLPFKLGLGTALGSGNQYMPWIHIADLCNIYLRAIQDPNMNGAYNVTAPQQVTNKVFTTTLARVMHKPYFLPNAPAWFLKIIFGEKAEIFLEGSRISSAKISSAGYEFLFPELEPALINVFSASTALRQ